MCVLRKKSRKSKKYIKYSKRDGKYTKFQILAASTVARLHKKFGQKNPKKNPRKYFAESLTAGSRQR
jgi:hypothetical protein